MKPTRVSPTGVAVVVIGLVALGAALATVFATAHGPSVNPDGVSYLRMADRLPPLEHPPGHFPEGYPAVLAALHWLGFGPIGAARWLDVGLVAVNVVLAGLVAMRMAGPRWAVLVALAFATSATIMPLSASINSEPLFITFVLGWVLLIDSERPAVVTAAGVLAAGAAFVRFAGFAFVVAGVIALRTEGRRARAYTAGVVGALVVWGVVRIASGGTVGRDLGWHPPTRQELLDGIASTQAWVTGHEGAPLVGSLVIVGSILLLWQARGLRGGRAIASAAACYAGLLALTVLFFDAQTPLNARLFAPSLVLVLLSLPALSTMRGARVLSVVVVVSIIFNASATSGRLDPFDNGILGIANAPTVVATRELDGAIASNAAGALWLLTGKEVRWIPKVTDPYTDEPTHDFQAAIGRLRDGLRGGGHLVWLAAYDYRNYLPTEEQVVQALGAVLVERFADGAIYALGP